MAMNNSTRKPLKVTAKKAASKKKPLSEAALIRFEKRKAVIEAVHRGEGVELVSRLHKVPVRSIFRWLSWYRAKGWDGLKDGKRSGRPSKVSPEAVSWLYKTITGGDPRQLHFEFALWTLALIRAALKKFQGIELSKSAVSRLMAQLGLTPQVPVYRSYKQSAGKVRYYLKTRYPQLAQWAKRNKAEIFFADESRVRADGHRGTTWAPVGETPVVKDSGDRFGINMISGVSAKGAMFFRCFEGKMDSGRFIEFLKDLRASAQRTILVIVDGGSYHKSKLVRDFLHQDGDGLGIRVEYLPPYSPELNPDEQVWNQAKCLIGKMCISTKSELVKVVSQTLAAIQNSIELVKSFFQIKYTKYASLPA
jgi:transposase